MNVNANDNKNFEYDNNNDNHNKSWILCRRGTQYLFSFLPASFPLLRQFQLSLLFQRAHLDR